MNGFGIIVVVFIAIFVLLMVIRLGTSINSTRRMSGEGHWSADGAEIGGIESRGTDHHHGHHNEGGHHNAGGHHDMGGGHHGGFSGGGDFGGGHHG